MSNLRLNKIMLYAILPLIMNGCAPLIPDNYLGPSTIRAPQKIHGRWIEPKLTIINAKMINTCEGQLLLEPVLKPQPYQVGAYDNLNIIVWGHPEVSTISSASTPATGGGGSSILNQLSVTNNPAVLVQTDGTIYYPYVGHLKVAGFTVDEIQNKVTQRLSAYIRNPQVSVQVAKFRNRNAYVLGEVRSPGMFPLTDKPLTLMEAISAAGGIDANSADPTHVYIVRGSYLRPDIFWIDMQTPAALMIASRFPLQENDIVYISAATLNSFNHFVNQVLPTFSTYYTIKGLAG